MNLTCVVSVRKNIIPTCMYVSFAGAVVVAFVVGLALGIVSIVVFLKIKEKR